MAFQTTANKFGAERARRYRAAMMRCPTARYLEVLPLFCLLGQKRLREADIVDLGSGTGYLADFFDGVARSVLRVDKSEAMLKASGSKNTMLSDMRHASRVVGNACVDVVTCLAAFHHVHQPEEPDPAKTYSLTGTKLWGPERFLDIDASAQWQHESVKDWGKVLRKGGLICLIDVTGYPDRAWDSDLTERHSINTKRYYDETLALLSTATIDVNAAVFAELFKGLWRNFRESDPHMLALGNLLKAPATLQQLLESYRIPREHLRERGPMIPADFFDEVLDGYGAQRHFGFFPRETMIARALKAAGCSKMLVRTFPTPWLFADKREAAWFVHELFGLGTEWAFDSIPKAEVERLIEYLDTYLGFFLDGYGRTMLNWQLGYFIGDAGSWLLLDLRTLLLSTGKRLLVEELGDSSIGASRIVRFMIYHISARSGAP